MAIRPLPFQGPLIDVAALKRSTKRSQEQTTKRAKSDFERTTRSFEHEVTFSDEEDSDGGRTVGTDDRIYGYLDDGTKPHEIRPRRKKALAFRGGGYRAKTSPGVLGSGSGGASGPVIVRRKPVQHPGTAPRNFAETIARKYDGVVQKIVQDGIDEAVD